MTKPRMLAIIAVIAIVGIAMVLIPLIGPAEHGGWTPAISIAVLAGLFFVLVLPRALPQLWRNRRRLRHFLRGDPPN